MKDKIKLSIAYILGMFNFLFFIILYCIIKNTFNEEQKDKLIDLFNFQFSIFIYIILLKLIIIFFINVSFLIFYLKIFRMIILLIELICIWLNKYFDLPLAIKFI